MKRLLGGICMAAGILIGGASGLCTGMVVVMTILSPINPGMLLLAAIYGGPPMLVGFGLYKLGRWLIRRADAADATRADPGMPG